MPTNISDISRRIARLKADLVRAESDLAAALDYTCAYCGRKARERLTLAEVADTGKAGKATCMHCLLTDEPRTMGQEQV